MFYGQALKILTTTVRAGHCCKTKAEILKIIVLNTPLFQKYLSGFGLQNAKEAQKNY